MGRQSEDDRNFPEPPDGLLTAPDNHVLAFMDTPESAFAAIDELAENGFSKDGIFVLAGPKGAEQVDVAGAHHGLRGRIHRVVDWMGDEREVLVRCGENLSGGGLVVTVPADDDAKAAAAHVLAAHGGHEIAHFGKRHWEPLGP